MPLPRHPASRALLPPETRSRFAPRGGRLVRAANGTVGRPECGVRGLNPKADDWRALLEPRKPAPGSISQPGGPGTRSFGTWPRRPLALRMSGMPDHRRGLSRSFIGFANPMTLHSCSLGVAAVASCLSSSPLPCLWPRSDLQRSSVAKAPALGIPAVRSALGRFSVPLANAEFARRAPVRGLSASGPRP